MSEQVNATIKHIGAVIRDLRLSFDWTQRKLAEKAGIAEPSLSQIENGRNPSLETLNSIALALGRHPYEILWLAGPRSGNSVA
tara:strand:- start:144 stop:392 length:249 start_codon:yes stop_codon:yes gene_type:complete